MSGRRGVPVWLVGNPGTVSAGGGGGGGNISPAGIIADVTHAPAPTLLLANARAWTPLVASANVMLMDDDISPLVRLADTQSIALVPPLEVVVLNTCPTVVKWHSPSPIHNQRLARNTGKTGWRTRECLSRRRHKWRNGSG